MTIKPHIARELATLAHTPEPDDATIFCRVASDVMARFAREVMGETMLTQPRIVQMLKRIAIDFDQPVKVELVFDVIAALELRTDTGLAA